MSAPSRFSCPGCSAGLEYDPQTGSLHCPFCGTTVALPDDASAPPVAEMDFERFATEAAAATLGQMSEKALEVHCGNCGAAVTFEPPEVAGVCPFCASKIVEQPKSPDPLIAPQAVLPFVLPREQATGNLRQWFSTRWFAPGDLKSLARPERLEGVYLPFWTYDANTTTDYIGQRGEHYWETETYTVNRNGRMETETRQVRHTRWYPAAGKVDNSFDDLLVPASRSVNEKRLNDLEPWDLPALKVYEPYYLAGFKAQRYQVGLTDGFKIAQKMMEPEIYSTIRADIGGDEQRIHRVSTQFHQVTFKHLLLPSWIGAFRYRGKVYQVAINARTGEVCGERPYSAAKIALLVLTIVLVVLVLWVLANLR